MENQQDSKLALKKWGFGSKEAAAKFAANNKARA